MYTNVNMKAEYRRWFSTLPFAWNIVVEPYADKPYSLDEIKRRLRYVEFNLNKRHLGSRFNKLDRRDRFWVVGFQQGSGADRHVHVLLYVPERFKRNDSPLRRKLLLSNLRWWWLLPEQFADREEACYKYECLRLYAAPTRSVAGSVIYNTRYMDSKFESDDFFFIHD